MHMMHMINENVKVFKALNYINISNFEALIRNGFVVKSGIVYRKDFKFRGTMKHEVKSEPSKYPEIVYTGVHLVVNITNDFSCRWCALDGNDIRCLCAPRIFLGFHDLFDKLSGSHCVLSTGIFSIKKKQ